MYVDTHSHIYAKEFADDLKETIQRSKDLGVERIYMPNIDASSIMDLNRVAESFPEICIPQMGLHPCYVKEDYKEQLRQIRKELERKKYSAVGEIGIDLYWDKTFLAQQTEAFKTQIEWAKELSLPIVIHSRDSLELTIEIVSKMQNGNLNGIFHCFSGTEDQISKIEDLGFYIGIGGVITFKNGGLDKVLAKRNCKNFVLETDSPYLAPKPYRGKRNESAYIPLIAQKLSEVIQLSIDDIARMSTENANKVYQYTP